MKEQTPELPVFHKLKPSQIFEDAFSDGTAGSRRECTCGRVSFNPNGGWDWEDGELEELEQLARCQPHKYIGVDYSVPSAFIDGEVWVMGCPCNKLAQFEAFIVRHDRQIAEFLRARAKSLRRRADESDVPQEEGTR